MAYETLDSKLIDGLLGDGRESLRRLADELGVSVTTVSTHVSDLGEAGVIEGYTPIVDYGKLGSDVTAIVRLTVEGHALPDLTDRLRAQKQMISVYEVTGSDDVVAIGTFEDTDGMNDQIKAVLTDPDVTDVNTSVVLDAPVENEQFELDLGYGAPVGTGERGTTGGSTARRVRVPARTGAVTAAPGLSQ